MSKETENWFELNSNYCDKPNTRDENKDDKDDKDDKDQDKYQKLEKRIEKLEVMLDSERKDREELKKSFHEITTEHLKTMNRLLEAEISLERTKNLLIRSHIPFSFSNSLSNNFFAKK